MQFGIGLDFSPPDVKHGNLDGRFFMVEGILAEFLDERSLEEGSGAHETEEFSQNLDCRNRFGFEQSSNSLDSISFDVGPELLEESMEARCQKCRKSERGGNTVPGFVAP